MSQLRYNVITGDWVIIATERARRPEEFVQRREKRALPVLSPACPFCPGNEAKTPDETFRVASNGVWLVRSVPNKFSALNPEGDPERHDGGFRKFLEGVGLHEVIIETPAHDGAIPLLGTAHVERILGSYHQRFLAFHEDARIEHVIIFKNHGEAAGTSLEHPHSQIVGTPVVPGQVRHRVEEAMRFHGDYGECLYCRSVRAELAEGERIVAQNDSFVAFVPYAALSPFHIWVFPRRHHACFGSASDTELSDLAVILKSTLQRLRLGLDDPDYNFVIRSLSPEEGSVKYFHWYLSLVPRVSKAAGFELGTGMFINTAMPEKSAAFLRGVPIA